jgi:hypothetical protein
MAVHLTSSQQIKRKCKIYHRAVIFDQNRRSKEVSKDFFFYDHITHIKRSITIIISH